MDKLTFEDIEKRKLLIYRYIRGSHAFGLQKPDGTSDVDEGAVFIEPKEWLYGLGLDYQEQVADERNDTVWYSLKKFMNMLLSSNPTVLESLFIPDRCVLYEHPIMTEIKKHRDEFVTKETFKPFLGYSRSQIAKCRSLHKMFLQEDIARKTPLDFCYTNFRQGSTKVENWLDYRGLNQKYCGLVNVPNMMNTLNAFYDWGNFFLNEHITVDMLVEAKKNIGKVETTEIITKMKKLSEDEVEERKVLEDRLYHCHLSNMVEFILDFYHLSTDEDLVKWYGEQTPIGYKGIMGEDNESTELRLSSVLKDERPIFTMTYNKDAYSSHCRDYKNMQDWKKHRNPERYKENTGKLFDRKNVSHAVRLLHMGIEIAKGEGVKVDRTDIDRDFILNIRLGNTSYEDIIKYIEDKKAEMEEAMEKSTLPEKIDVEKVNEMLIKIRKEFYGTEAN